MLGQLRLWDNSETGKGAVAGRRRSCWGPELESMQSPGAPRQARACRAEPRSTWARRRWSLKSPGAPGRGDRGRQLCFAPQEHLGEEIVVDSSALLLVGRDPRPMDEDDVVLFFN
jgi:hypothetical protein